MPIFNAKMLPASWSAICASLAVGIVISGYSLNVFAAGNQIKGKVVVIAASTDAGAAVLPRALTRGNAVDVLTPASTQADGSRSDAEKQLTKSELANAKFAAGLEAHSAGEGRLAESLWSEAADNGHMAAQWNLARLYRRGDLVEADPVKALTYLRIVASRHDPDRVRDIRSAMTVAAMVEIANMTRVGVKEAKLDADPAQAARLYELAATLYGNARAQHHLGMMYLTGEGVSQHIGRAVRWLALSAGKRYAPSLAALGDFFWEKRDTGDNKVRGLMWLSLARDNAKHDDLRATVTDRYEAAMIEANEEERQQVIALIQNWNQSHISQ